jgi:tetratricopeptide (TPR) repeat protein
VPRRSVICEALWLLVAILVPLWVNFWANQPFDLSKTVLLRTLVWLMFVLCLSDGFLSSRSHGPPALHDHKFAPLLLALAITVVLATLLAADPLLSFLGSRTRAQGALTLLCYPLLFLMVSSRLTTQEQARRLILALLGASALAVLLALLQAVGIGHMGLLTDARSPIIATLGRSNFAGAYLALLLPLTLAALGGETRHLQRGVWAVLFMGQALVITLTLARGAWLAAVAGLSAYGFLLLWPRLNPHARRWLLCACLGALAVGLAAGGYILWGARSGSVAARRTIWIAAWDLIRQRPWFGYGPDSLEIVFHRVYPPQLVYYHGRDVFVDRAHNWMLDHAVTLGIPGLLAWAGTIIGALAYALRRYLRRAPSLPMRERRILAACISGSVAALAGNLISFDVTATAMVTWLLLALGASPRLWDDYPIPAAAPRFGRGLPVVLLSVTGLIWLTVGAAIVQFNVRPLVADGWHHAALRHHAAGETPAAIAAAQRSVAWWPLEPAHHLLLGRVSLHRARTTIDLEAMRQAESAFIRARNLRPLDPDTWVALGDCYGVLGAGGEAGAFPLAHEAYREALSLSPHHARLHVAWGLLYLLEDRSGEALALFYRAHDLDATDGVALRLIGDMELALGRVVMALEAYRDAARWSPEDALVHLGLARAYAALGEQTAAWAALGRALELEPEHPAVRATQRHWSAAP